jgi:hypothetical protein
LNATKYTPRRVSGERQQINVAGDPMCDVKRLSAVDCI